VPIVAFLDGLLVSITSNVFTVLNNLGLLSEQPVTTAEGSGKWCR